MEKDELTREEMEALSGGVAPAETGDGSLDALRTLHEEYFRRLATALSAMLRSPVVARVLDVRPDTCGQFISCCGEPACRRTIRVASPECVLLLDVAPSILYAMMGRLLGGDPMRFTPARRPPTEIERRLASRIMDVLVAELQAFWKEVLGVQLDAAPAESNAQGDRAFPSVVLAPDEAVVVTNSELGIGRARGAMRLCVPSRVLAHVSGRLQAGGTSTDAAGDAGASAEGVEPTSAAAASALVEVRAELARAQIAATDVLDLSVGDIIATDRRIDEPLVIDVDGRVRFQARPGSHEGRKAVQIEKRIEPT